MDAGKFMHGAQMRRRLFPDSFLKAAVNRYCYMFPDCVEDGETMEFTDANKEALDKLGDLMGVNESAIPRQESDVPAGYTYFGQFVDHDITFEPFSSLDEVQAPDSTTNLRTPCLDLDSLYEGGPAVSPYLFDHSSLLNMRVRGLKFAIGRNTNIGPGGPRNTDGSRGTPSDFDLPRTADGTALIGDPRNDENLIVSQLHHAFLRFHNQVVDQLANEGVRREDIFERARRQVVHHYQWVVVHDFMRRIIPEAVWRDVFEDGNLRLFPSGPDNTDPFRLPVEFAVAAYRYGHSQVRDTYDFNDNFKNNTFLNAFNFVSRSNLPVFSNWVVDFNRFFDTGIVHADDSAFRVNMAMKIDTNIALSLESLPSDINASPTASGGAFNLSAVLASRNLRRGLAFQLPSGQCLAEKCGASPIPATDLFSDKIKMQIARSVPPGNTGRVSIEDIFDRFPEDFEPPQSILDQELVNMLENPSLAEKTPLWYYILREAELASSGEKLGPCGGRVVAECFYRMLDEDPDAYVHAGFRPNLPRLAGKPAGDFDMADLLNVADVLTLD